MATMFAFSMGNYMNNGLCYEEQYLPHKIAIIVVIVSDVGTTSMWQ